MSDAEQDQRAEAELDQLLDDDVQEEAATTGQENLEEEEAANNDDQTDRVDAKEADSTSQDPDDSALLASQDIDEDKATAEGHVLDLGPDEIGEAEAESKSVEAFVRIANLSRPFSLPGLKVNLILI